MAGWPKLELGEIVYMDPDYGDAIPFDEAVIFFKDEDESCEIRIKHPKAAQIADLIMKAAK